ncbi:sensor histidine kinase [Nocardia amikacinitolerans]|uniref:sensor histidine kinase n=1 Tax=Nocardia amikacinitolerans TaxID=756689 RepID=UPI0036C520E1
MTFDLRIRSSARPPRSGASLRVLRLYAAFVGAGFPFYLAVLSPRIHAEDHYMHNWWTPFAICAMFLPAAPLLVAAAANMPKLLRFSAELGAVGYIIALIAWPAAWKGQYLPDSPWMAMFPGLAAMCVALVWKPRWVIGYLAVVTVGAMAVSQARVPEMRSSFFLDVAFSFPFSLVFVAATLMAVRAGRILDEKRFEKQAAAASAKTLKALRNEREWFFDLVHGWVMMTVGTAATEPSTPALRRTAATTLKKFDELAEEMTTRRFNIVDTADFLRAKIREVEVDGAIQLRVTTDEVSQVSFPGDIVRNIGIAAAEAVRNSFRHAGDNATRKVNIDVRTTRIRVLIADDGIGFDPYAQSDRNGLKGLRSQIDGLPGGHVEILSEPGHGARVEIVVNVDQTNGINNSDVRTLLGMRSKRAWGIVALFVGGVSTQAIATAIYGGSPESAAGPSVLLLVAVACAAASLIETPGDRLPLRATLAITVGAPLCTAWVMLGPWAVEYYLQVWPNGAFTAVATFMCVRGRTLSAWAMMLLEIIISARWSTALGHGPELGLQLTLVNLGPMLMATMFAATIRPAAREIYILDESAKEAYASRKASEAVIKERTDKLAELDSATRPLLERIARGDHLSIAEMLQCKDIENRLEATLEASALVHPIVTPSAEGARLRGVDVALTDQHGIDYVEDMVCTRILTGIASELDRARSGFVRVRILPPERDELATVFAVADDVVRRVSFDREGCAIVD